MRPTATCRSSERTVSRSNGPASEGVAIRRTTCVARPRPLPRRQVHRRGRVRRLPEEPRVAHDADDFRNLRIAAIMTSRWPNRIRLREELPCHALGDDDDGRCSGSIGRRERTSAGHSHRERCEVVPVHIAQLRKAPGRVRHRRVALSMDGRIAGADERRRRGECSRLDAGC